jgi:hypothetical protein
MNVYINELHSSCENDVLDNWNDGWPYIFNNEIVLRKAIMNTTTSFIFTCSLLLDFWKKLEY